MTYGIGHVRDELVELQGERMIAGKSGACCKATGLGEDG